MYYGELNQVHMLWPEADFNLVTDFCESVFCICSRCMYVQNTILLQILNYLGWGFILPFPFWLVCCKLGVVNKTETKKNAWAMDSLYNYHWHNIHSPIILPLFLLVM